MCKPLAKPRILIAEDNPDTVILLHAMSKHLPYDLTVAQDGKTAIEAYEGAKELGQDYDLLILDAALPRMNGFQIAEYVRETGDENTRIIFWTADDSPITHSRAISVKADAVWLKPHAQLPELIGQVLGVESKAA